MYRVTRLFLNGLLKGMTYTETTNVLFAVGFTDRKGTGSGYTIVKVEKLC